MAEIPSDYVLGIVRQAIDGRIDALEKKIDWNHSDVKADITEIKMAIKEFQTVCNVDMKSMDARIKDYEQFKYKLIAYSGVIAVASGVAAKIIFS